MCMISEASSKDVAKFYLVLLNLKKPDKGDTVDVSTLEKNSD